MLSRTTLRAALAGAVAASALSMAPDTATAADPPQTADVAACSYATFRGTDATTGRREVYVAHGATGARVSLPTLDIENPDEPLLVGDGSRLLITGERGGPRQILVGAVGGDRFTSVSGVDDGAPIANQDIAVSVDGTTVAWIGTGAASDGTFHAGQVWVAGIDGSNRRNISDGQNILGRHPVLSHDGRYVAWTADVRPPGAVTSDLRAIVADTATGEQTILEAPEHELAVHDSRRVAISPDGTRVAWAAADRAGAEELAVTDVATGTTQVLLERSSFSGARDPIWAPHGAQVVGFNGEAFVATPSGRPTVGLIAGDSDLDSPQAAWSPHAGKVAVVTAEVGQAIRIAPADQLTPSDSLEVVDGSVDPDTVKRDLGWSLADHLGWVAVGEAGSEAVMLDPAGGEVTSLSAPETVQRAGEAGPRIEDPDDVEHFSWSPALTTVEASIRRDGDVIHLEARNTGPCSTTAWASTVEACVVAEPANRAHHKIGTAAPGETVSTSFVFNPFCEPSPIAVSGSNFIADFLPFPDAAPDPDPGTDPNPDGPAECPTPATDAPFTDTADSFAHNDITCIFELGITTGTSPTTYSPTNPVTREQMAAFIARTWRALGNECPTPATDAPFTDTADSFAHNDITCIFELGITTGTSPTTYSPTNPVTREQMAAFIARTWRAA